MKSNSRQFIAVGLVMLLLLTSSVAVWAQGELPAPRLSEVASLESPYGISDNYYKTGSYNGNKGLEDTLSNVAYGALLGAVTTIVGGGPSVASVITGGIVGGLGAIIVPGSAYDTPNLYYHVDSYQHRTNTFVSKKHFTFYADSAHTKVMDDYVVYYTKIPGPMVAPLDEK